MRSTPLAAWTERAVALLSWVDLRLALRLLVKYPGLTLVGGLGIAVAVAIGVGFFALFHARFYPHVPLPDGDRLVALENWDRRTHQEERRALADFAVWRDAMTTVEDVTAFRDLTRNVSGGDEGVEVAKVSEITPSGFRLARVPPLVGRTLVDRDSEPGAPPVVVIGADVWRSRFKADANVINARLQLDATTYTIVGVMPDGFAFPVNHRYWIPMTLAAPDPSAAPGTVDLRGRSTRARARIDDAQTELTAIGQRLAAAYPDTHADLRPEVLPYTYPFAGMSASSADAFWPVSVLVSLILIVVSVNVAILIYARTATRLGEIAIRSALGASRGRIVAQLTGESVLLSTGAAIVGVLLVKVALEWMQSSLASIGQTNFWTAYTLSPAAIVYAGVLAALAAALTGVVPALRATGRRVQRAGLHLGRTWTTLIVVQVSIASAALPVAIGLGWFQVRDIFNLPRFPVEQILFAEVALDQERADLSSLQDSIVSTPGCRAFRRQPRVHDESAEHRQARADRHRERFDAGWRVASGPAVDRRAGFLSNVRCERARRPCVHRWRFRRRRRPRRRQPRLCPSTAGRRRRARPTGSGSSRTRGPRHRGRGCEIVGVVENIDRNPFGDELAAPRIYQPLTTWDRGRVQLAVRLPASERGTLARRLPDIGAAIDPALQVKVVPLEDVYRLQRVGLTAAAAGIAVAVASVLLLSAAGIFALMSFTVTQRRREIAIRTALGASSTRLLGGIFHRALRQISVGVIVGVAVALVIDYSGDGEALAGHAGAVLPLIVAVMILVGLIAALGPARRGLRIEPVEALKSE